jgi:hypothetical protein
MPERPWSVLRDRTRARCLQWERGSPEHRFTGEHAGFAHRASGARVRRTIIARQDRPEWTVRDEVSGRGAEPVTWRLHLGRESVTGTLVVRERGPGRVALTLGDGPAVAVELEHGPDLAFAIETTPASDRYGERHDRPCLVLRGQVRLPLAVTCVFRLEAA